MNDPWGPGRTKVTLCCRLCKSEVQTGGMCSWGCKNDATEAADRSPDDMEYVVFMVTVVERRPYRMGPGVTQKQ